jgi:hypothetical protein
MSTEVGRREVLESTLEAEAAVSEAVADRTAKSAVIGAFDSHSRAEQAVKALEASGFPMRQSSIVGS